MHAMAPGHAGMIARVQAPRSTHPDILAYEVLCASHPRLQEVLAEHVETYATDPEEPGLATLLLGDLGHEIAVLAEWGVRGRLQPALAEVERLCWKGSEDVKTAVAVGVLESIAFRVEARGTHTPHAVLPLLGSESRRIVDGILAS